MLSLTARKPFPIRIFDRKQKTAMPMLTLHSRKQADAACQPGAGLTLEAAAASPAPVSPLRATDKKHILFYLLAVIIIQEHETTCWDSASPSKHSSVLDALGALSGGRRQ